MAGVKPPDSREENPSEDRYCPQNNTTMNFCSKDTSNNAQETTEKQTYSEDKIMNKQVMKESLSTAEEQDTDIATCSKSVSLRTPPLDDKTIEKDDENQLKIISFTSENSDDDYVSDENSSPENESPVKSTGKAKLPCKRKKTTYHQRSKKRKFAKTGSSSGHDDNLQGSTSKSGDRLRSISKHKIPFRFSPKKSCSGTRFKRKLQGKKLKKLRFKKRKVDNESSDESCFGINDELEETLEANATKNNLTAINVKSILHHVITNEHVLAMVRNTMLEEEKKEQLEKNEDIKGTEKIEESEEASFEPKMTRSKLKEVVQQARNAPYVWPLSPVKNKKVVPQFAEINFDEDSEDDEDYKPDPNEKDESDHESYLSSQVSEFGSPSPFTPLSQHSFLENKEESPLKETCIIENTTEDAGEPLAVPLPHLNEKEKATTSMLPPSSTPQPDKISDDDKFMKLLDEMDKELDSMSQKPHGTDIIAKRTRSKLTIENSLDEIEASFVAPDITADMYDSDCEDNKEWKEWLNDLFKDKKENELNDTFDDEQNDPDFNFMADEEEVIDTEETRTDRAVRVSKKELNVLLDELLESYGEESSWTDTVEAPRVDYNPPRTLAVTLSQLRNTGILTNNPTSKVPVKVIPIVTPSERLQLQQQMQQHVQLLCQLNLLGRGDNNYNREAEQAKMFLNELAMLGGLTAAEGSEDEGTSKQAGQSTSAFVACNLQGALEIVNNWKEGDDESDNAETTPSKSTKKQGDSSSCSTERHYNSKHVPKHAKIILMSSIVFMYPELLPHHGLRFQSSSKPTFVDSEDHLIVLGLHQFDQYSTKFRLIQKHLIPGKTVKQIQARIKNFSTKKKRDNIIKNYRKHKIIPLSFNPCRPVLPGQEVAPIFQFQDQLPDWMKNLKMSSLMKLERDAEKERKTEERTRKAVLASVNESTVEKIEICKLKKKNKNVNTFLPTSCPVALVQTVNGQQIIKLLPNQLLPNNPVTLPTVINVLPQPTVFGSTQNVTVGQIPQPVTVVPRVCVPTSNISVQNGSTMQTNIVTVKPVIEKSTTNVVSNQLVTATSSPALSSVTTPVTTTSIVTLQTHPASQRTNSVITTPVCSQPTVIMIPQSTPQRNFVLVKDNSLNNDTNKTDGSVNEASSSNVSIVPSKSEIIQLSPGKHGQVIKFGGRQSLAKDANKKSDTNIVPSCLNKGTAGGISALKGFQIHQNNTDLPKAEQGMKPEIRNTSPQAITASEDLVSAIQTSEDGQCSPSPPQSFHQMPTDKHSHPVDVTDCQLEIKNNHSEKSSDMLSMKPVVDSDENRQKQMKTNPDVSIDSGIPIDDESTTNDDYEEDDIDVEGVTADDEDQAEEDKEIELDEDDFELDVVNAPDSKSYKELITDEMTSPDKSLDPGNIDDNSNDEGTSTDAVSGLMSEEQIKASRKVAAKRLKSRLRKEMESTVVLLDPEIVKNDPKKAERDDLFATSYLSRVKNTYKDHPIKYIEFLNVLAEIESNEQHIAHCYEKLKNVLHGHDELIEDFTAFLDPTQAMKCGVLMSYLEFSKAKLFLREVEVHFQKQPGHFQKILKAIVTWGDTENRTYQQLKDVLLPLLKGQPHLEQELSSLFPYDKPAETLMPDFEMAEWSEDKEFDGFEEVELPDSEDEEKHLKGKIHPGKVDTVDPWQTLNAELQYGTKRCRCSCHDRSLDTRVQKKTRHCAYCAAKVSRAELTSSFRGIASVRRRASTSTRIKVSKSQKGSEHIEVNDNDEDHDDGTPYSAAVSNLSEMCSNLADYLNENACGESEEMEEDAVETEEEDIEEMEMDDDEADEEVQKLIGDGLVVEDDPELITGADTTSSNSPDAEMSSQESKGSSESEDSNIGSPEYKSPLSNSFEVQDNDRSEDNSPIGYSSEDNRTESIDNAFIAHDTQERHFEQIGKIVDTCSNSFPLEMNTKLISINEPCKNLPTVEKICIESDSSTDTEGESRCSEQNSRTDSMHCLSSNEASLNSDIRNSNVVSNYSSNVSSIAKDVTEQIKQPDSFQEDDKHDKLKETSNKELIQKKDEELQICDMKSSGDKELRGSTEQSIEKDNNTSKCLPEDKDFNKAETSYLQDHKDTSSSIIETTGQNSMPHDSKSKSKISADNVTQKIDGSIVVSWTRDEDRLLLQTCQTIDNNKMALEQVSEILGNKSLSEIEERFNTLMTLFTKRPKSDGEDSVDRSDDSERSSTSDVDE
ncbi:GON-4-like protein [Antedon mediterranea]|uniref:GON-4-like protein n=1 Tax=Antedon mediterranea TaxID=105859 RepID=UPI003AF483D6